ncbi:hypothetical protein NTH44_003117 [Vibrio metoecus]|nr:hypothetical protein [Vibrio cholerae]
MNVQTLHMFGEESWVSPVIAKRASKTRKTKNVKQFSRNEDFLKVLFPEDYSQEEHIAYLMNTEVFAWCEEDVRDFQIRIAADVTEILHRTNSSLDAVSECLNWIFYSDPDYEFSIHQCAARVEYDVMYFRNKYVNILANTLRTLRKSKARKDRIDFYWACLMKANKLMDDFGVKLTRIESSLS